MDAVRQSQKPSCLRAKTHRPSTATQSSMRAQHGWDVPGVATKPKGQHSGSAAESNGGFMYSCPPEQEQPRQVKMPGYLGHRPLIAVAGDGNSPNPKHGYLFERATYGLGPGKVHPHPNPQNSTLPGYTGVQSGAMHLLETSTFNKIRSPGKEWVDNRPTVKQYHNQRSYREEVNGIVPGYRGHMPGALRSCGTSNYGGLVRQASPNTWAQARHAKHPGFENLETARSDFTAVVPEMARAAAVEAFRRGTAIRESMALMAAEEARSAKIRSTTTSGMVERGVMPGYNGHVPRYVEEVGVSPYRGRGADSATQLGLFSTNESARSFHEQGLSAEAAAVAAAVRTAAAARKAAAAAPTASAMRSSSAGPARPPSTEQRASPAGPPRTPRGAGALRSSSTPRGGGRGSRTPRSASTPRARPNAFAAKKATFAV